MHLMGFPAASPSSSSNDTAPPPTRAQILTTALNDAVTMLTLVLSQDIFTDPQSRQVFLRYFQPGMEYAVRSVLETILGADEGGQLNPKFQSHAAFYNGPLLSGYDDNCAPPEGFVVYLKTGNEIRPMLGDYVRVVLCEVFWDRARERVLANMDPDTFGAEVNGHFVAGVVGEEMVPLAGLLIQEFTHW